ncbi:methyl-accepting chemotaxis protein [Lacimicrobium sp. SS2-24]|uniref:methyl-accepting chemotaxis protein n=1 Tax=Lacimicrobium sp. SS2-24 TaxID=2005569 RepID=UPI000B4A8DE0|nr:methyl-accepting chemotaxis protein [Lacimicrobium sp. SS2-24]
MFSISSIRNKLILISLLVLIGMLGMLLLQSITSSTMNKLNAVDVAINQVQSGMLMLRRNEKDFLLRNDISYQGKFNDNYNALQTTTRALKADLQDVGFAGDRAQTLIDILSEYKKKFDELINKSSEIGLTPESGYYGALRSAVHDVEEQVNEVNSAALKADMLMLRRHEKDFMLRKDMKYTNRFEAGYDDFMSTLSQSDLPAQTKAEIERLMGQYQRHFSAFVAGQNELGLTSKTGLMGEVRDQVRATEAVLSDLSDDIQVQISDYRTQATLRSSIISLLTIAVIIAVIVLVSLSISRPVRYVADLMRSISDNKDLSQRYEYDGADEINAVGESLNQMMQRFEESMYEVYQSTEMLSTSAEELNSITQSTRDGVNRQQHETESVAAAMNEMTTTVQDVSHSASEAAEASKQADKESVKGRQLVNDAVEGIRELAKKVVQTAEEINVLEEEAKNISTVLQVISEIAEQTNLLALNAAIEAARAGEQGRGFAVVADEVRTLASRSHDSTEKISTIIERLQQKTNAAVHVMKQGRDLAESCVEKADIAGKALEQITIEVSAISEKNYMIASAADEQKTVSEEINRNVVNINDIAKASTEAASQTLETSHSLAQLATELQNVVQQFKMRKVNSTLNR